MMEFVSEFDLTILKNINFLRNVHLDYFMILISKTTFWIPLYLFLIILIAYKFKRRSIPFFILLAIAIALSDLISARFFKPFFERLRPCWNEDVLNVVNFEGLSCGGKYGFVSSHATNTFSVAFMFYLFFKHYNQKFIYLFFYPLIVSFSRMYLVVHYFTDIVGGLILSFAITSTIYLLSKRIYNFKS